MKEDSVKSIRAFIGAKDFELSKAFYHSLGFEEVMIGEKMSLFHKGEQVSFYLQDYYVEEWVNNTMLFLEVNSAEEFREELLSKNLSETYREIRISSIVNQEWGNEFFLHDPSGVLWHIGDFFDFK
ncbi:VOC family protein [Sediminitomix flava]|uniref:Catechol 2,3-dioxygenase-like lactoylglutathione lyase family enzyme n=1 Tax=Sediminitomix flava TaxID=379075 RepID=A0A315ZI42_SEDFL|nr:glyoxalase [Sediminitomix flava]PWJ44384.1 hypothetical protein BC781_101734 [Sediminitomix flava]